MHRSLLIEGRGLEYLKLAICEYLGLISSAEKRFYNLKIKLTSGKSKDLLTAEEFPEYDEWLVVNVEFEKKYRILALEFCKGIKKLSDYNEECHLLRLDLGFTNFGHNYLM